MEPNYMPRTVEEVFDDYKGRRAGLINALTTDFEEFYRKCDPESENLCLYAYPQGQWKVTLPVEEVPPVLPEPVLGINFVRDKMIGKTWLSLVAIYSDAWLVSVSTFYGATFNRRDRERLFRLICELPTVFEVVTGREPIKDESPANNHGSKLKSSGNMQGKSSKQASLPAVHEKTLEENKDSCDTFCGCCGSISTNDHKTHDEFWIGCDICEKWFHLKCVKVTPVMLLHMKQYKCPYCTNNKRTHL